MAQTTSSQTISWAEAQQRAQRRIADLANRRTFEARNASLGEVLSRDSITKPSFRVGQLDTELLDEELLDLLKGQLWSGFKYFNPTLKETYESEFMALLRLALFKLTIWDHNATYGAALQNLAYADARRSGHIDHPPTSTQKLLYGLCTVGGRYAWDKLNAYLISHNTYDEAGAFSRRISRAMDRVTTVHSVASLISFLAFLTTGRYRTLLDRVLRMRLVTPTRQLAREVSFEYLNRQLVWHAFTEFLLFVLPIVGVSRWRRWFSRLWKKSVALVQRSRGRGKDEREDPGNSGVLGFLPERTCAICFQESTAGEEGNATVQSSSIAANDVTNPYEAVECGHVYCYVCLATKIELEEGDGWTCLRCGRNVTRCRPWREGVVGLTSPVEEKPNVTFDEVPKSPREEHGMENIIESIDEEEEEELDPINEDPINEIPPIPVFAGGEDEEDESDGSDTERGNNYSDREIDVEDEYDTAYDTADDGGREEEERRGRRM